MPANLTYALSDKLSLKLFACIRDVDPVALRQPIIFHQAERGGMVPAHQSQAKHESSSSLASLTNLVAWRSMQLEHCKIIEYVCS